MHAAGAKRLWFDRDHTRHFLIPEDAGLPPGELALRTAAGRSMTVDAAAAARYAIPPDEARAWVDAQINDLSVRARDLMVRMVREPHDAPPPEPEPGEPEWDRGPAGPDAKQGSMGAVRIAGWMRVLNAVVQFFGAMLDAVVTGQEAQMHEARERIRALRLLARDRGLALPERLEDTPEVLHRWYRRAARGGRDPVRQARRFEDAADWVDLTARMLTGRLRDTAHTLREAPPEDAPADSSSDPSRGRE